jgi:adenine phosphoribosyltransferase
MLQELITSVQDYPKEGIDFKDITTLLSNGDGFRESIEKLTSLVKDKDIDFIVSPEARGFIFGAAVAFNLGIGFIPIRKKGKLPRETVGESYILEYGEDSIYIHKDAIKKGDKVIIIDDLLSTGGTSNAQINLIEKLGGTVEALAYLIELDFLNPRVALPNREVFSVIKY